MVTPLSRGRKPGSFRGWPARGAAWLRCHPGEVGDDVGHGRAVPRQSAFPPGMIFEKVFERFGPAAPGTRKCRDRRRDRCRRVTGDATARVQPMSARDALVQRAQADPKRRLPFSAAGPRREADGLGGEVCGDGRRGRPGIGVAVVPSDGLRVGLQQRHDPAVGWRQRPELGKARGPAPCLGGVVMARGAGDGTPGIAGRHPPALALGDQGVPLRRARRRDEREPRPRQPARGEPAAHARSCRARRAAGAVCTIVRIPTVMKPHV
jgi:hypothetical protein